MMKKRYLFKSNAISENEDDAKKQLRALLKRVRQLELSTRKMVNNQASGAYHTKFKGRGMAFEESRAYVPGDDPRHVDWNTTARTGDLHIKVFAEERELTLILAVDLSASMAFGTGEASKKQMATEAAAMLAFSALRNNDKVGLLLFTDRVERLVRPQKGRGHVMRILRDILSTEPRGSGTDLALATKTLSALSKQRAIVAILSDFQSEGASITHYEKPLRTLGKRHDVMMVELADPKEVLFPDVGLVRMFDPETGQTHFADTSLPSGRQMFTELIRHERQQIRSAFRKFGLDHATISERDQVPKTMVRLLSRGGGAS